MSENENTPVDVDSCERSLAAGTLVANYDKYVEISKRNEQNAIEAHLQQMKTLQERGLNPDYEPDPDGLMKSLDSITDEALDNDPYTSREYTPAWYYDADFIKHIESINSSCIDFGQLPDMPKVEAEDFIRMTDVVEEPIEWLWEPFIPLGKTTFIMGDTKVGKTTLMMAIAANISRGQGLPLGNVIYLTSEDSITESIKPKLKSMNADFDRIITLDQSKNPLSSIEDPRLINAIETHKPLALIIDPIKSFLGTINMNSDTQVRVLMDKLNKIAEKYNCAIILLAHTGRKSSSNKGAYRAQGSVEFATAARSVLRIGVNPNEPDERAITIVNSNHAVSGQSYSYAIDANHKFEWLGSSDITSEEMDNTPQKDKQGGVLRQKCAERIKQLLANGPMETKILTETLVQEGFKTMTIKRAKEAIKVESSNQGTGGKWYTKLPTSSEGLN